MRVQVIERIADHIGRADGARIEVVVEHRLDVAIVPFVVCVSKYGGIEAAEFVVAVGIDADDALDSLRDRNRPAVRLPVRVDRAAGDRLAVPDDFQSGQRIGRVDQFSMCNSQSRKIGFVIPVAKSAGPFTGSPVTGSMITAAFVLSPQLRLVPKV